MSHLDTEIAGTIYQKILDGDTLSNREIEVGIEAYETVIKILRGPHFSIVRKELIHKVIQMKDWQRSRKEKR